VAPDATLWNPATVRPSEFRPCGLNRAGSHSGRRTFITNLAAKGVSVRIFAELASHSSISTTQRYIDVNDNQMRAAVELA